jgi:glucose-6-phosphate dehydrogenase assembly protein OpcA
MDVPEAAVTAQCWMPFGRKEQICCEQVEIRAAAADIASLKPFLLALIAPDLPVVVWIRGPLPFDQGSLGELAPLAEKIIVDSEAWPDAPAAMKRLAAGIGNRPVIADLSWTRLTRWREMIAQVFENCACSARLNGFREIEIEYGGARVPVAAYYLAAWLARGLGWFFADGRWYAGTQIRDLRLRSNPDAASGSLNAVALRAEDFEAWARRTDGTAIELAAGTLHWRGVLPKPEEAALLTEELAVSGRDRVFEEVAPVAARFAAQNSD